MININERMLKTNMINRFYQSRIDDQVWIDTKGVVHKWKGKNIEDVGNIISIHGDIAKKLYPNSKDPMTLLFNKGWCAIGSEVYYSQITTEPTIQQMDTLYNYGVYVIKNSTNNKQYKTK